MKNVLAILALLLLTNCVSHSKHKTPTETLKYSQFSDLDSLMNGEQRPIAIFLQASWCKFCKNMEQTTLKDQSVIDLLNEQYYFISFDGEQKENIDFHGHQFKYQPTGRTTGTHELATALGQIDGVLTYPTFVLLNKEYEIIFQHNAFMDNLVLNKILEEGIK